MIELIITSAGKKEIVNAQQTGTSAIKLSHIGVGSGKYTATEARTSLQSETKRLPVVEGGARNGTSAIFRTRCSALSGAFSFGSTGSKGLDAFDYGVVFIDTLDDGSYRYSVSYRDIMVLEAERKRRFE